MSRRERTDDLMRSIGAARPEIVQILRFILDWLSEDEADMASLLEQLSEQDARIAVIESLDLAALDGRVAALEGNYGSLVDRVTALENANNNILPVDHLVISINTERNTNTMAFQIKDNDTTKVASVTYKDALGFDTTDPGVVVAFASSDPAIVTIDATSGAITPVKPGAAQVQATATNTDGTVVTGSPADVEILAGAAASFAINIA